MPIDRPRQLDDSLVRRGGDWIVGIWELLMLTRRLGQDLARVWKQKLAAAAVLKTLRESNAPAHQIEDQRDQVESLEKARLEKLAAYREAYELVWIKLKIWPFIFAGGILWEILRTAWHSVVG